MFCISKPAPNIKNEAYAITYALFCHYRKTIVFYPVSGRVVRREGLLA